jgi:ribosomal protein S18 acetylase RimI-like enzyme
MPGGARDMNKRVVERATVEDIDSLAALNVAAYEEFSDRMTTDGWLSMKNSVSSVEERFQIAQFLVVRESDRVCGSVAYCPAGKGNPELFPPDWAAILLLAVAPEFRSRGIGKGLASACIDMARRDGACVIGLFTSELMIQAQRLYESLGFLRESEIARRNGLRYCRYRLDLVPGGNERENGK